MYFHGRSRDHLILSVTSSRLSLGGHANCELLQSLILISHSNPDDGLTSHGSCSGKELTVPAAWRIQVRDPFNFLFLLLIRIVVFALPVLLPHTSCTCLTHLFRQRTKHSWAQRELWVVWWLATVLFCFLQHFERGSFTLICFKMCLNFCFTNRSPIFAMYLVHVYGLQLGCVKRKWYGPIHPYMCALLCVLQCTCIGVNGSLSCFGGWCRLYIQHYRI